MSKTTTKTPTATRRKQHVVLAALGVVVLGATLIPVVASAALDDGRYCITADGYGKEFQGNKGVCPVEPGAPTAEPTPSEEPTVVPTPGVPVTPTPTPVETTPAPTDPVDATPAVLAAPTGLTCETSGYRTIFTWDYTSVPYEASSNVFISVDGGAWNQFTSVDHDTIGTHVSFDENRQKEFGFPDGVHKLAVSYTTADGRTSDMTVFDGGLDTTASWARCV
jgi:hypothetical protein